MAARGMLFYEQSAHAIQQRNGLLLLRSAPSSPPDERVGKGWAGASAWSGGGAGRPRTGHSTGRATYVAGTHRACTLVRIPTTCLRFAGTN